MYKPNYRVVEVSKEFYVELAQALQIEERWVGDCPDDTGRKGAVLYVVDATDGESRKLFFTRRPPECYWDRLTRFGKNPRCRLYRTDYISKNHVIYNVMVWKPEDPFLRIEAKTICMMEYA